MGTPAQRVSFVIRSKDRACPPEHSLPMKYESVSLLMASALLLACGPSQEESADAKGPDLVIGDETPATANSIYQMPTPNELFTIVREMAGEGQKRMMNPAVNADRYANLSKRAVNFGVYSTDLIYASYFDLNVEVVRYYLTVKKLGDELGLTAAFNEGDFVRLESNLAHGDSLEIISNEAYYRAYEKLQNEQMGATLALVLAGGWVESMHLVIKQINTFDPADPLVLRVGEQKFTLEHVIDMMEPLAHDSNVAPIRDQLVAIRGIYDRVKVSRSAHKGPSSSGRMVLGDDVQVELTAEDYAELAGAVEALRSELVRTDDEAPTATNS